MAKLRHHLRRAPDSLGEVVREVPWHGEEFAGALRAKNVKSSSFSFRRFRFLFVVFAKKTWLYLWCLSCPHDQALGIASLCQWIFAWRMRRVLYPDSPLKYQPPTPASHTVVHLGGSVVQGHGRGTKRNNLAGNIRLDKAIRRILQDGVQLRNIWIIWGGFWSYWRKSARCWRFWTLEWCIENFWRFWNSDHLTWSVEYLWYSLEDVVTATTLILRFALFFLFNFFLLKIARSKIVATPCEVEKLMGDLFAVFKSEELLFYIWKQ